MKLTHEQKHLLKTLGEGGLTPEQTARLMGLPLAQVRYWMNPLRNGYPDRQAVVARAEAMARLYRMGRTLEFIGKQYNITRERVRQILKEEMGVTGAKDKAVPTYQCKAPKFHPTQTDKYWAKVDKTPGLGPNGDCWIWRGMKNGPDSSKCRFRGAYRQARRVAFFLEHKRWSEAEMLGSTCRVGLCVNPAHILEGTRMELFTSKSPLYRMKMIQREEKQLKQKLYDEYLEHLSRDPESSLSGKFSESVGDSSDV